MDDMVNEKVGIVLFYCLWWVICFKIKIFYLKFFLKIKILYLKFVGENVF